MKKSRKFVEVASRLWPTTHRRYQEMCALAVTGQLGGAQMCELNEHIAACESCRKFLESVAQISAQALPLLADKHAPAGKVAPPEGMRERFLSRLASEELGKERGIGKRAFAVSSLKPFPLSPERRAFEEPLGPKRWSPVPKAELRSAFSFFSRRSIAAVAACVVVAIGGYYTGARKLRQTPQQVTKASPSIVPASDRTPPAVDSDHVRQLERRKTELEGELARLKERLSNADDERQSLRVELAAAKEKLAASTTQAQSASQNSLVEGQEAKNQVVTLQSQVDRLNQRLAESDVKLDLQRQTSVEVRAKLETTTAELQRERDLKSAKSDLGDVVAARNLHIVDVYDADPSGKRQRSFGRVFYIEGKSLVFYAYDLDDPGRFKANVVFHVWGGKAGVKEVTHSLGILHRDDAGQGRWAMTFDDPKVLAQINSVFVTAESASKLYDVEPHGKRSCIRLFREPGEPSIVSPSPGSGSAPGCELASTVVCPAHTSAIPKKFALVGKFSQLRGHTREGGARR